MDCEEQYVSFETAKLLKEKGFDGYLLQKYDDEGYLSFNHVGYINSDKPCDDFYALAPTLQMAMKWLREVHKIIITIDYNDDDDCEENERWGYSVFNPYRKVNHATYVTYEEAAEDAIKYCLENLI